MKSSFSYKMCKNEGAKTGVGINDKHPILNATGLNFINRRAQNYCIKSKKFCPCEQILKIWAFSSKLKKIPVF